MKNESALNLWDVFLKTHPDVDPALTPKLQTFGTEGTLSITILDNILKGKAKGWIEPLLAIQCRGESLPVIGGFVLLVDSQGRARAVIQIKTARLHPLFNVPQKNIELEGSGLKSLETWKTANWDNLANQLKSFGKPLRESSIVVCTAFDLVFTGK
jgi:uncharacterized protein YhfF